jgi:hypothetical protein
VTCCERVIFAGPVVLSWLVMPLLLSCPTWGVSASVCVDAVVSGDAFRAHFPVADVSVYCGCMIAGPLVLSWLVMQPAPAVPVPAPAPAPAVTPTVVSARVRYGVVSYGGVECSRSLWGSS